MYSTFPNLIRLQWHMLHCLPLGHVFLISFDSAYQLSYLQKEVLPFPFSSWWHLLMKYERLLLSIDKNIEP